MAQSISANPDFQTVTSWSMIALSAGTDDLIFDSSQTIGAVTAQTALSQTYNYVTTAYS